MGVEICCEGKNTFSLSNNTLSYLSLQNQTNPTKPSFPAAGFGRPSGSFFCSFLFRNKALLQICHILLCSCCCCCCRRGSLLRSVTSWSLLLRAVVVGHRRLVAALGSVFRSVRFWSSSCQDACFFLLCMFYVPCVLLSSYTFKWLCLQKAHFGDFPHLCMVLLQCVTAILVYVLLQLNLLCSM